MAVPAVSHQTGHCLMLRGSPPGASREVAAVSCKFKQMSCASSPGAVGPRPASQLITFFFFFPLGLFCFFEERGKIPHSISASQAFQLLSRQQLSQLGPMTSLKAALTSPPYTPNKGLTTCNETTTQSQQTDEGNS